MNLDRSTSFDTDTSAATADDRTPVTLAAFVCGIVTGAALGLLLAPARGRDTRAQVRRHAVTAADRTRRMVRVRRERLHAFIRQHGVIGLRRLDPSTTPETNAPLPL